MTKARSLPLRLSATLAALLLALIGTVAPASPAAAAATCLGTSNQHSVIIQADGSSWYHSVRFTTTNLCKDINIKISSPYAWACVVFINVTDQCNYSTKLPYDTWTVIATNVKDNVDYRVDVYNEYAVLVSFVVAA